jgi:predicted ester cyclase
MSSEATPSDQNKATVQRLFDEVVNLGDLDVADELFASDCVLHDPIDGTFGGWGSSQVKNIVDTIRTAFPDVSVNIVEPQLVAGDDHVITQWTATGTHTGHLNQPPFEPSGERVEVSGMSISRFTGSHIEEMWLMHDPDVPLPPPPGIGDWVCRHCRRCCR